MVSSVEFAPPASSALMKEQTCFVKHVETNTPGKRGEKKRQTGSTEVPL